MYVCWMSILVDTVKKAERKALRPGEDGFTARVDVISSKSF